MSIFEFISFINNLISSCIGFYPYMEVFIPTFIINKFPNICIYKLDNTIWSRESFNSILNFKQDIISYTVKQF